ncbi:signal recognition particle subunit [Taxawa tesnikishii (nom. ined.)]|nr:signal recognition particle subunit [Dothideales sp. JES 119]
MSRQARVEELSDSDSDPPEMDPSDFDPAMLQSLISPANIPSTSSSDPVLQPHLPNRVPASQAAERERTKHYQCLYPVYFDSTRSRAEGRRVGKEQAVPNPLAREIADACSQLGLGGQIVFEPGKCHPKDWANPGRTEELITTHAEHHLYNLVADYLKAHPTTEESPMRLRIAGMPPPTQPVPPPAVPKGWKMGSILPLHSPALTGGGVSENFFKDMMAEMQGQQPGLMGGADAGGSGGKKKDKKKGKA